MRKQLLVGFIFFFSCFLINCEPPNKCVRGQYFDATNSKCVSCSPGTFSGFDGASTCQNCADGYYATYFGSTTCQLVAAGYYADKNGTTQSSCPRGTFSFAGAKSINECYACRPGYYANNFGTAECKIVPAGYFSDNNATAISSCPRGTYSFAGAKSINECYACRPGYYADTWGNAECKLVPAGSYADLNGTTATSCPPGTYSFAGAKNKNECYNCKPGYYANYWGSAECKISPAGSYADKNGTATTSCPPGTYSFAGAKNKDECFNCKAGYYANYWGSAECKISPAGSYSDKNGTATTSCPPGTYSFAGAKSKDECFNCKAGYFANYWGTAECKISPAGSYADKNGTTTTSCPPGTYSYAGSKSISDCLSCKPGYYANYWGSAECKISPAGSYSDMNGTGIASCPPGTYSYAGAKSKDECFNCKAGYFANYWGSAECKIAPAGSYSDKNGTTTTSCPPGTYSYAGAKSISECFSCKPGYYANYWGSAECKISPAGSYSDKNGTTITSCPPGTYSYAGAKSKDECFNCKAGYYANYWGSAECKISPAGSYSDKNGTTITSCPPGTYSFAGAKNKDECYNCKPGYYANYWGSAECKISPAGSYSDKNGTTITSCPPGTYSFAGARNKDECYNCKPGYYANYWGTAECKISPAGSYSDKNGTTTTSCPPGTYSFAGAKSRADCYNCQPGYYANYAGSTECKLVPAGSYSDRNASTTTFCPRGTYSFAGAKSISDCISCKPGYYADNFGSTDCKIVPEGYYADKNGTTYTKCPKGTTTSSAGGRSIADCSPCPPGYFRDSQSTDCKLVPAGSYSSQNGTFYSPCPVGTYSNAGAINISFCLPCDPGYYASNTGSTKCLIVPAGFYSVNGTFYDACPIGTYSMAAAKNLSDCIQCPAGFFSDDAGSDECRSAPPGYYVFNASTVEKCPRGTYSERGAANLTECLSCTAGRFSEAGSRVCTLCSPGTYEQNRTVCNPCPQGTFGDDWGVVECKLCPKGTFSNQTGLRNVSLCQSCDAGYVSVFEGQTSCVGCPAGSYETKNRTSCDACPVGTFSTDGTKGCSSCPDGSIAYYTGARKCTPCAVGTSNDARTDCVSSK